MKLAAIILVAACWAAWLYPFLFRAPHNQQRNSVTRKGATAIGLLLESVAIMVAMGAGIMSDDAVEWWRVLLVAIFSAPSIALAWSAVQHLGKQFRVNAGLYDDHELVHTGAYAVVRHPIYAGLFGMLLATIAIATPVMWAAVSVMMFLIGTEIRVHTEDALLRGRFGESFDEYRRSVKAYIPYVR